MRCTLRRLVTSTVLLVLLGWLVISSSSYLFDMRQKSILRYQIEQEMKK